MYDDILVPTDGSPGTAAVAAHAGALAAEHDARVHLLSVADTRSRFESPSSGVAPEAWAESERERAQAAVDAAADALPAEVPVERAVVEGVPAEAIVDYAADVDLVVMGTHGRTGLDHYLIGSVAERVVRRSSAPVLTVRVGEE